MFRYFFFINILLSFGLCAQTTVNDTADTELKVLKWDTLKYQKFDYVFIVGLFQQHRNFTNTFQKFSKGDTSGLATETYNAESKLISGFTLSFDKFQISLGTRSTPQNGSAGKGYTK